MVTTQQIRTAVTIGKLFQKTRREKNIQLHTISNQSGIPLDLLVKIESGNLLAIKRDAKSIEYITNIIAQNLDINIDEYYPSKTRLDVDNVVELFPNVIGKNVKPASKMGIGS